MNELIKRGIEAVKRCIERHDMETAFVLLMLCQLIAGDEMEVTFTREEEE